MIITVPLSTGLALLISAGLSSIKTLRNLFQTVYFLPYVTNTLAVGSGIHDTLQEDCLIPTALST